MKHQATDPFRVMELFPTIQGEGTDIGRETVFVRLYGCNLKCVWCDTAHSWDEAKYFEGIYTEKTVEQLVEEITAHEIKHVVITGGEPLLHNHEALLRLCRTLRGLHGIHITFETNGTIIPSNDLVAEVGLFSVSPKLSSSGNFPFPAGHIDKWLERVGWYREERLQFKFVIATQADAVEAVSLISKCKEHGILGTPIIFQPEESANNYKELPDMIAKAFDECGYYKRSWNIRYIPQVHKLFNIR